MVEVLWRSVWILGKLLNEKLQKPTLIAAQEYEEGKVYYRNPAKEKEKLQ